MGFITWFLNVSNNALDVALPWVGLAVLGLVVLFSLGRDIRRLNNNNRGGGIGMGEIMLQMIMLVVIEIVLALLFWWLPALVSRWTGWGWMAPALRWIEFYLILILIAASLGKKHGEGRWFASASVHFAVLLFGWLVDRWTGIFFISLTLIGAYYVALYRLALVVLPANNPEDGVENWGRFAILAAYTWGAQFPLYVVAEHAWKKPETRIQGTFTRRLPFPGLIWTKSHQAVGITSGTEFRRVAGPGVVYMGRMERPFQVIDLRSQLRSSKIDVVSKDGIKFKAIVFTAFRIDPNRWDAATYGSLWQLNPNLQGAKNPDQNQGSFPYSGLRVEETMRKTSTKAAGDAVIFWDQWVLNVVEDEARKNISQKTLDELWRPANDTRGANALDIISNQIKANTELQIRAAGILLFAARIVNFEFTTGKGEIDPISKQQIATWGAEWERRRTRIMDEAQAQSDQSQQEARAYAESLLLNSIAEGLQKTQEINPNLPRYVIAVRFLSALQDYIHRKPNEGEETIENDQSIQGVGTNLGLLKNRFLSDNNQEKPS